MEFLRNAFAKSKPVERVPTALCISEDTAFLNSLRIALTKSGFVVIITSNATEALVLIEDNPLDVIVCDYELSQIDGISLFEKIQATKGEEATPPTLIVTDKYAAPLLSRCVTAGAAGLQSKKDSMELVVERVISLIQDTAVRNALEVSSPKRMLEGSLDILTRVASRKQFSRRLSAESVASYRDHNALSLLFLAVDNYAQCQERYGEKEMEAVLAKMARIIEGELRSRDCVGRYADHTFGVVLPETPRDAAVSVGDRLRRIVAATEFGSFDHPITVTVSVGAATRTSGMRASPSELIATALRNCSASQQLGGDRVTADQELTGQPVSVVWLHDEADPLVAAMQKLNVEVRVASDSADARDILESIPVKFAVVDAAATQARDTLVWLRNKHPKIVRILCADQVDTALFAWAVNEAKIDFFLPARWDDDTLATIVRTAAYT